MIEPKKPKLSIGMPVYNAEKFLRNRLDSLLSQTFSDFELIISDDASTSLQLNLFSLNLQIIHFRYFSF